MADGEAVKLRPLEVGDAVLFDGDLYRVEAIKEDEEGIFIHLRNDIEECDAALEDVTFIARDSLSGMKPKAKATKYPFKPGDWVRHVPTQQVGQVDQNRAGKTHVAVRGADGWCRTTFQWSPDELERAERPQYPSRSIERSFQSDWPIRDSYRPKPEPKEPELLITTGSLIQDEVKKLRQEEKRQEGQEDDRKPSVTRKLRTHAPGQAPEKPEEEAPVPVQGIPKRRGDW